MKNKAIAIIGIGSYISSVITSATDLEGNFVYPIALIAISQILKIIFTILATVRLWKTARYVSIILASSAIILFVLSVIQEVTLPQYGSPIIILLNVTKIIHFLAFFYAIILLWTMPKYESKISKIVKDAGLIKMNQKDHIEKFVKKALNWELWVEKADELIEVAALIKPHIDQEAWNEKRERTLLKEHYFAVYFMLMSYALENLLKALKIKNNSQVEGKLKQTTKLPTELVTHDIYSLAKDSGVLSEDDYPDLTEALLKRMSICATWFGRYPTPTKAIDMKSFIELESADYFGMLRSYDNMCVTEIDRIIELVYAKLGKQAPKSLCGDR